MRRCKEHSIFKLLLPSICLVTLAVGNVDADCNPQFKQVNEDGFGDPLNIYAWAMKAFNGYLYVGTGHLASARDEYSGTAELWRFDGTNWEQIIDDGFGNPNNTGIRNLVIYKDYLYAGVLNAVEGAQIWRSKDGMVWGRVMEGGFNDVGNEAIRGMVEFDGYLFAGAQDTAGGNGALWASPGANVWLPIAPEAFGFPNNSSVHDVGTFKGRLYAGIRNTESGAQVWRTVNGIDWKRVVGPSAPTQAGFGNPLNVLVFHFKEFGDRLYLTTGNARRGFGVFRTEDGVNYEQIADYGFGDRENAYGWRMHVYEGALWLGVANTNILGKGGSVFRTYDGTAWEEMIGANGSYMGYGFDDTRNWGIRTFETYNGKLYLGTAQCWFPGCETFLTGAEVWEWPGESCP